jgi:hypothetical protein
MMKLFEKLALAILISSSHTPRYEVKFLCLHKVKFLTFSARLSAAYEHSERLALCCADGGGESLSTLSQWIFLSSEGMGE